MNYNMVCIIKFKHGGRGVQKGLNENYYFE